MRLKKLEAMQENWLNNVEKFTEKKRYESKQDRKDEIIKNFN